MVARKAKLHVEPSCAEKTCETLGIFRGIRLVTIKYLICTYVTKYTTEPQTGWNILVVLVI